jgi:hypothetical protein
MHLIYNILPFILLFLAVAALIKKFFWKKKTKSGCGKGGCGCD